MRRPFCVVPQAKVGEGAQVDVFGSALRRLLRENASVRVSRVRTQHRCLLCHFTAGASGPFRGVVLLKSFHLVHRLRYVQRFVCKGVVVLLNRILIRRDDETRRSEDGQVRCLFRNVGPQYKRATRDRHLLHQVGLQRSFARRRRWRDGGGDRCRRLYRQEVRCGRVRGRRVTRRSGNCIRGVVDGRCHYRRAFKVVRGGTCLFIDEVFTFIGVVLIQKEGQRGDCF